ncbi:autotransporter-associated betastr and repeat-containing protein [Haloferula helveola]|uniref:Autotransporter-associated betastr and repeat-containing protein n=1 Tax=Haloferula helveola TaxID=490095 RepID=A0ABN6H2Q6_9BACT|nr:autotransporter-associated betastr and repeat-containing protein [Haloferula helveola]
MKSKINLFVAAATSVLASAHAQTTVFFDDFENGANDATVDNTTGAYSQTPDVDAGDSDGNTSGDINSTLWVKANQGFGATRQGLIDESHGDFTDPTGEQAWGFRYTNSGITTAEGVIGALVPGATYTITFDVVEDGHNGGTPWSAKLYTVNGGSRNDARNDGLATSVLASASGSADTGATYEQETFSYTVDPVADAAVLGHDVTLRFFGATTSATIDNVKVEVTYATDIAYWDIDGSTPGSGGATPAGTWDAATTNWNPDPDGTGTVAAWTPGDIAIFAAGADATGTYSVTVDGAQDIGALIVEEGAVSLVDGTSGALNLATSSPAVVASGAELTIDIPITDATDTELFTKDGAGQLTLTGDNSAADGGMALNGGITQFDTLASINGTGANVAIGANGILSVAGSITGGDVPTVLARVDPASTGTIAADNVDTADFDFDAAGLTDAYLGAIGTVDYTGTLTPSGTTYRLLGGAGGTLTLNSALTSGYTLDLKGPGTLQLNGFDSTVDSLVNSGGPTVENGNASTAATLTVNNSSNESWFGTFQDGGAATLGLTKDGSGILYLRTNNSITGDLTILNGTVQLGNNGDTGSLNGSSYPGNVSIAAGSTFRDRSNNSVTMSGVISGDGSLHKDGSGTMTLTGANTYTGQTEIRASGGGGPTLSVSSLNSVTSPPQMPSSSLGVPADAAAGTIILGSGTNVRNCTLIYTGPGETTDRVMAVSFNSGADQEIRNTGGGLLKFTEPFTINRSSGNNGGRFTLGGSGDGEVEAGMTGGIIPGDLWKDDAGTWTLGGTTTADDLRVNNGTLIVAGTLDSDDSDPDGTGTVNVTGGTLQVDGSLTADGAFDVNGGTLGGSGTVTAAGVTVAAGANLAPGSSVGTLDIDGDLDISALAGGAGVLDFELDTVAASDQIAVTGTLAIGSGALGLSDFNFTDLGGLQNGTYTLISSGGLTGTLDGADLTATDVLGGDADFELQLSGNDVVLAVTGLPGGNPFDTWAATGTLGAVTFEGDTNGDGVQDGLAFLLGVDNPDDDANGALPTVTEDGLGGLVLTFNCLPSGDRGTAELRVEHSSDIGATDPWLATVDQVPDATDIVPDNDVTFVVTAGSPTNSVVATIGSAAASGGTLFGRLTATE